MHVEYLDNNCEACGRPMATSSRFVMCQSCKVEARNNRRELHATRIAGYVPPAGSVAFSLLGRVVNPIQGLGI